MTSAGILKLLESLPSEFLGFSSIVWGESNGIQDAEMALLVDEGGKDSLFLEVLHSVLIKGRTEVDSSVKGHATIEDDLLRWFKRVPDEGSLVLWLKVAAERFPMRLFVVCDWNDQETLWPGEDAFWLNLEGGSKTAATEESTRGINGVWRTPDPRPWKGPSWRRFLGKRICWLAKSETAEILGSLITNDYAAVLAKYFMGISAEGVGQPLELFPLWLRLKWVEHLARRVRGLDWSYRSMTTDWPPYGTLRLALDLATGEPSHSRTYKPSTLPPLDTRTFMQHENHTPGPKHCNNALPYLERVQFHVPHDIVLGVELHWTIGESLTANAVMETHQELFEENGDGSWTCAPFAGKDATFPGVLFAGALSGALVSHNSLVALGHDSWSIGAAWRLLEVAEHALVRIAICDERFQEWWEREAPAATNGMQRRVFSLFWEQPGAWNQGEVPAHGYSGRLGRFGERWEVEICGPNRNDGLLQKLFQNDPWPAAADMLLVHQGILDKWENEQGAPTAALAGELMALKDQIPWLIVTSGRGKPDRVAAGVRFLPLSGLQACLVGNRFDKLLLVRQLAACGGEA